MSKTSISHAAVKKVPERDALLDDGHLQPDVEVQAAAGRLLFNLLLRSLLAHNFPVQRSPIKECRFQGKGKKWVA